MAVRATDLKRAAIGAVALVVLAVTAVWVAPEASAGPVPLPRITTGSCVQPCEAQLTDSSTNKLFVPRGYNYVRLASTGTRTYHSLFEPGQYKPNIARIEAFLTQMQRGGYNTVRVFIDPGNIKDVEAGAPHGLGRGVDDHSTGFPEYYDNVADFVRRATAHKIYVMPIIDLFPQNGRYFGIMGPPVANVGGRNAFYLKLGGIKAKRQYAQDFVTELRKRLDTDGLMSTLLALSLDNEATWRADEAPFSQYTGTVTGPDGKTYDMAQRADRQQVADASIVLYASHGRAGARAADPNLLITIGTFTHAAVGKTGPDGFARYCSASCEGGDWRYPARAKMLSRYAGLDFLDIHSYPGANRTLLGDLTSIEWSEVRGIVVMGEYGVYRRHFAGDVVAAAYAARDHQVNSCGMGFDGWLFWTWDTTDTADQQRLFTGAESAGAINGVLAPVVRPDPCRN